MICVLPFWIGLLAYASAQTCSSVGECVLDCTNRCNAGSLDCTRNSLCSINCNGTFACNDLNVTGLYQPNGTEYIVRCSGTHACIDAVFTTRNSPSSRFLCNDYSCSSTLFDCRSENCELVCAHDIWACMDTTLHCPGGENNTCHVLCDGGGCNSGPRNVTCQSYPCNITVSGIVGTRGFPSPCPPGMLVCGDRTCVDVNSTCPSQCIYGDPCKSRLGNGCEDLANPGGPIRCTCNSSSGYINGSRNVETGEVTSCVPAPTPYVPEGPFLSKKTYSNKFCTGVPVRTEAFFRDCGATSDGYYCGRCTESKYCLTSYSSCDLGASASDTNVCQNGTMYVCGTSAANKQLSVSVTSLVVVVVAFAMLLA